MLAPLMEMKCYRDISLVSYSGGGGGGNKGTVSYLLEDSWPRLYIVLGWTFQSGQLEVLLSIADKHLQYEDLLKTELNSLVIKVESHPVSPLTQLFACHVS